MRSGPARERGVSFSEYAVILAVLVAATIGALALLESKSGSYLTEAGSDIGTPRSLAADYDGWTGPVVPPSLTQPPPPTTTTTTPTTITTTVPASSTSSSTSTTLAASFPSGGVILQGAMSSELNPGLCFQAVSPGVSGSQITAGHTCDGSLGQEIVMTGIGAAVGIQLADPASAGLCFTNLVTEVKLEPCIGTDAQVWDIEDLGGGLYTFHSRSEPKCLLDTHPDGASKLERGDCNGNNQRQFSFA